MPRTLLILTTLALSACATTATPEEVCTAAWIEPRAERALERIEDRVEKAFKAFRSAGAVWASGGSPGPLQMYRLSRSLKSLERELTDGRGIRDLRYLAETCDDPDFIEAQIGKLLRDQRVPDQVISLIEALDIYRTLSDGPVDET